MRAVVAVVLTVAQRVRQQAVAVQVQMELVFLAHQARQTEAAAVVVVLLAAAQAAQAVQVLSFCAIQIPTQLQLAQVLAVRHQQSAQIKLQQSLAAQEM
jgi:hypothetical protein